jgi:hypothetical protein
VKLRLKTWLLVYLLAFTANFGVTVSRVAPPREPSAIVHVQRDVEETPAEVSQRAVFRFVPAATPRIEASPPAAALHASLFQRPPPFVLFLS